MGQGSEEVVFWHNRMSWGRYHVRARLSLLKSMLTKQILVHNQCFIYQFVTALLNFTPNPPFSLYFSFLSNWQSENGEQISDRSIKACFAVSYIGSYGLNFGCVNQDAADAIAVGICHGEIWPLVPVLRFQGPGSREENHSTLF